MDDAWTADGRGRCMTQKPPGRAGNRRLLYAGAEADPQEPCAGFSWQEGRHQPPDHRFAGPVRRRQKAGLGALADMRQPCLFVRQGLAVEPFGPGQAGLGRPVHPRLPGTGWRRWGGAREDPYAAPAKVKVLLDFIVRAFDGSGGSLAAVAERYAERETAI